MRSWHSQGQLAPSPPFFTFNFFRKDVHTGTFSFRGTANAFIKKYEFQGGKITEVFHGNRCAVIFRLVFLKECFQTCVTSASELHASSL